MNNDTKKDFKISNLSDLEIEHIKNNLITLNKKRFVLIKLIFSDDDIKQTANSILYVRLLAALNITEKELPYNVFKNGITYLRSKLKKLDEQKKAIPNHPVAPTLQNQEKEKEKISVDWLKNIPSSTSKKSTVELRPVRNGDFKDFNE